MPTTTVRRASAIARAFAAATLDCAGVQVVETFIQATQLAASARRSGNGI
jgi:hypothetical protein